MRKILLRIFSSYYVKGTRNYINSQKKYEVIRTVIFFFIPLSLFVAGYVTTKSKMNLLTIVAVVGLLPACKSLVSVIMFLKHRSLSQENAEKIDAANHELPELFDMVFTTYDKTHIVNHMVIAGNTVCGFSEDKKFSEKDFNAHIQNVLKTDGYKNISVKIFTDINKYAERLEQLKYLEIDEGVNILGIMDTFRSVVL
ncbi:MAG: hypothetical protein IKL22_04720 [Lachnospiraceae bacterium]|nr:hypothetical protein [Lachnospiraceae bacterium]